MILSSFSYYGVGKPVFLDGIVDSAACVNILTNNLDASSELMELERFIVQQDNDP